jgi:hypothetical protein
MFFSVSTSSSHCPRMWMFQNVALPEGHRVVVGA